MPDAIMLDCLRRPDAARGSEPLDDARRVIMPDLLLLRPAVDIGHRQVGLVLEGPGATDALAAGCPLDLHPTAFPVGMCTRTVFGKAEIVLWQQDAARFHVEVWRPFAPYVQGLIARATSLRP